MNEISKKLERIRRNLDMYDWILKKIILQLYL